MNRDAFRDGHHPNPNAKVGCWLIETASRFTPIVERRDWRTIGATLDVAQHASKTWLPSASPSDAQFVSGARAYTARSSYAAAGR